MMGTRARSPLRYVAIHLRALDLCEPARSGSGCWATKKGIARPPPLYTTSARGSTRGSAPTTSNAPPWHRGADDQAQRMTPGKSSRASTIAAGRRAAPNHGGRAAAARTLRHNANRARPSPANCSEGKGEGLAPSPRGELPRPNTRPRTHHPDVLAFCNH